MKKTKYLTSFLLFIISFLFIGELFIINLSNFTERYYALSFELKKEQSLERLLSDIKSSSSGLGIDLFASDTKKNSMTNVSFKIYGTEGAKDFLAKNNMSEGTYHSLILGKVNIEFYKLDDLVDNVNEYAAKKYYIIGSYEDCLEFGQALGEKYSTDFPVKMKKSYLKQLLVCSVWGIAFFLLLLISAYDIALIKREGIVRMILGEPLSAFISKNILKDTAVFILSFITALVFASAFTQTLYFFAITVSFFILFLLLNSLVNLSIIKIDFRKDAGSKQEAKNIIKVSYFYKCVAVLLLLSIMNYTGKSIGEGINYIRQGDFFQQYKGYGYLNVSVDPFNPQGINSEQFNCRLMNKEHISMVDLQESYKQSEYIYTDNNARDYLIENVKGLSESVPEGKIYFLIPETLLEDKEAKEKGIEICSMYYAEQYEYDFIFYDSSKVIVIKNSGKSIDSVYMKNPIIIYNNIGASAYKMGRFNDLNYLVAGTLFEIDGEIAELYAEDDKINFITDAFNNYQFHEKSMERNIFAGAVFLALMFLITIIISRNMIYYEYRIRAAEFFISKVLGNSPLDAYLKILSKSIVPSLIVCAICSAVIYFSGMGGMIYIVIGEVLVIITDTIISRIVVSRLNKIDVARILKGETV